MAYIAVGVLLLPADSNEAIDTISGHANLKACLSRLVNASWVSVTTANTRDVQDSQILQIYVRPQELAQNGPERHASQLKVDLVLLLSNLDTNEATWHGDVQTEARRFDLWTRGEEESLFYMFNTLDSPSPSPKNLLGGGQSYACEAMEDILESDWLSGLKTTLYPYQRRSAALMLEREERTTLQLDPRLEQRTGPDGEKYYYDARSTLFYKQARLYESCRGGILAETMGLGKTLICLTLILATQHHLPKVPPEYSSQSSPSRLSSLQQIAITKIQQSSMPWQVELSRMEHHSGDDRSSIKKLLEMHPPSYTIPILPNRWNRNTVLPPPKHLTLAATTLIVVPRNLCRQWQLEIEKHIMPGALSLLVMDDLRKPLPYAHELRQFDLVLFTRLRFELEERDGSDEQGRRPPPAHIPLVCRCPYIGATRERDCRCLRPEDIYESPLKHLHFKRLIIDEGHSFSAHNTKAMSVANKLVVADHRWIVSGTPAKDMIGVELDLATTQTTSLTGSPTSTKKMVLDTRRSFRARSDEADAIKNLGSLASNFLQIRPWYTGDSGEPVAIWDEHIYRHEHSKKRTYSCFSTSLRRTLDSMVIKTRPEDVDRDIVLPPLVHNVVYLEPSFFDRATANLFALVLIANAITSERIDQDYIFHKNNGKARTQLIANLRQSSFFWSGFSSADVEKTIKTSIAYLEKDDVACTDGDRILMTQAIGTVQALLESKAWRMLGQTHELGVYISNWPEGSAPHWGFDGQSSPVLTGLTQALEAQKFVDQRIGEDDPEAGLAGAGIRSLLSASRDMSADQKTVKADGGKGALPTSSYNEDPVLKRRAYSIRQRKGSGLKTTPGQQTSPTKPQSTGLSLPDDELEDVSAASAGQKRKRDLAALPANSILATARIIGTTSSKLSYLMAQVLKHSQQEKILIFYDGDHIAYYIAQALELLHIKHEIYAKSLAASLKSEYVVRFDQSQEERVLLMDVKQAAFGLNLASASRIYFVNPVCRPDVEAQAIKRAHRIGQTRAVHVETLILKGTMEQKMHERAQHMTRSEHIDARSLEDDHGMKHILEHAQLVPFGDLDADAETQMAALAVPQQLWARPGWQDTLDASDMLQRKRPRGATKQDGAAHDRSYPPGG